MGGSDFVADPSDDPEPYTYDDNPPDGTDPDLEYFSIAHDLPYIIPALKQALSVNGGLQIQANPWSPPAWMKGNGALDNDDGRGTLLSSAYGPFARYFVKFIEAYESNGVPIAAITPQNEPGVSTQYPGLALSEAEEAAFIANYLKPALARAGLTTKIYGNDLSWDQLGSFVDPLASVATPDIAGIAWHCYFGSPEAMTAFQGTHLGLDQIVNECSPEIGNFPAPEYLISSLRNWASVVSVWNLALDPQGGPKMEANGCPACIGLVTVDDQGQGFTLGTEYYQMGQVSAFVAPGASRIDSTNFVTYGLNRSGVLTVSPGLDDVAFVNPDGSKVLVTYNDSANPISFAVQQSSDSYFTYTIPAEAMTTFTWT